MLKKKMFLKLGMASHIFNPQLLGWEGEEMKDFKVNLGHSASSLTPVWASGDLVSAKQNKQTNNMWYIVLYI